MACGLAALGLLVVVLTAAAAAAQDTSDPPPKKGKEPADPPRTSLYMGQLRALFAAWDKNKDDYLDKEELAIALRGPGSKPFDYKASKSKSGSEGNKEDSKKDDEDPPKEDPKKKPEKAPDYSMYPDYQLLTQLDKDRDDKISRDEFMEWARDYAIQLRDQAEAQKKLAEIQARYNKLPAKSKDRKSVEAQLKKQQREINQLQSKLKKYQYVQKSLK